MNRFAIFLMLGLIFIYSCNSTSTSDAGKEFEIPDSIKDGKPLKVSDEVIENMIQNISSPVEMASLIKSTGTPFSQKFLCDAGKIEKFDSNFKRALGLGILGADLGYLNIYEKTGSVVGNLSAIKSISDELKIGQFFDFSTLKRLAVNNENLDSLIFISTSSFNQMDSYLRENERGNISALIVTGLWVEGLYIATQVVKNKKHDKLAERIGEQKLFLGDLLLILKNYEADPQYAGIAKDIEALKDSFADVKITYEKGEPQSIEKDGMLVIVQNEKSIVSMTDEQLKNIISMTEKTRAKFLSL